MTYARHFCATLLDHYQQLLPLATSDHQEVLIRRNIRLYTQQLKQHDAAHMDTKCNHSDLLVAFLSAPEGLTFQERQAHKALSQVDTNAIGFEGARAALVSGSVHKFRQLIREFNEQIEVCPDVMCSILGKEAFEAVVNLGLTNV